MTVGDDGPSGLPIRSFRLKNFKAVQDSGEVRFTPLTVFIGNNGSGKSSLIEGLQTYQAILLNNLNVAMQSLKGYEYAHNPPLTGIRESKAKSKPMAFTLRLRAEEGGTAYAHMSVDASPNLDEVFIAEERVNFRNVNLIQRDDKGYFSLGEERSLRRLLPDTSVLNPNVGGNFAGQYPNYPSPLDLLELTQLVNDIRLWQFVTLNPVAMSQPRPRGRTNVQVFLNSDGSNIAEYLLDIRRRSVDAFDGIIEALQYVLPYVKDVQPTLTSELERTIFLQLSEETFKIPGWLMSSGTLRVLALLALLRDPNPPPVIIIEEIENGLDPRTIHLIVEELRAVVENETTQVIITTHSPYLLDLLALSQIVLVERVEGQPRFFRPGDEAELVEWGKNFGSGRLYTMNRLSSRKET